MNNLVKALSVVAICSAFVCPSAEAFLSKDGTGTTSAQFLKLGIGAKSAGMGNAVVSAENGTDAIYWNPANLNYLTKKEFSFSHTVWFEDISYEWLAFALPTDNAGVFGFAAQYVSYGDLDRVDNTNTKNGSFSPADMAFYVSYANIWKNFLYGFNLKYIYSKIENSASAFALDAGANYNFYIAERYTSLGFALTNFGTKMKYNNEQENLPLLFKTGISHWLCENFVLALDLNFPNDNDFYVNAGTEYCIVAGEKTNIFFRAGFDGRNKDVPGFNWLTLGFGLGYADYIFDYAFVPYGDIGLTHRISLSIKFGQEV